MTAEFFRNLIGENTKMVTEKIETLSEDLLTLSRKVEDNSVSITRTADKVARQAGIIADQRKMIDRQGDRVGRLETGGVAPNSAPTQPRRPSVEYIKSRRSIRVWPVVGAGEDALWRGAGEFIHSTLGISEADMSPDDIESVTALPNPRMPLGNLHSEILITFFCPRKRDLILSNAPNLSGCIDAAGKPTAGIRLEFHPELDGTFRLLSRFGTRLRAQHGVGTKRHIKFDDEEASLFINIKLPVDEAWTKVTPATARVDQESDSRDQSARILKRITGWCSAPKDGPRQRLAAPARAPGGPASSNATAGNTPHNQDPAPQAVPVGFGRDASGPRGVQGAVYRMRQRV